MTGKASRDKGKRGELEIVHLLRDNLGIAVNRNYKQTAQAQHGDIEQLVGGHVIEVKNCKATSNIKAWWQQACAAADKVGGIPCLAYKIERRGWRFVVPMPEAWSSGHAWRRELNYTNTMFEEGFFLYMRERIGSGM